MAAFLHRALATNPGSGGGSGDAAAGASVFEGTCATCHGADASGIDGLGKDLANNEWIRTHDDDQLVAFLKTGRLSSDPLNTTGVDMPPRGGNPTLTDDDLDDVVAYLRTLQP
jgi:disulfide bond formation protein DsbB